MSPSAAVASNSTMMIERRKADDMSEPLAEKSPNTAARDGGPVRERRPPQIAPTLDRADATEQRRSGGRCPGIGQETHHEMRRGKNGAGQRGYGQQLNQARQREANGQRGQQLDVAAADPSALIDDDQQQEQDCRADQRLDDMGRSGDSADDSEQRQRQADLIMDQACRNIDRGDIEQQRDLQQQSCGSNPGHRMLASKVVGGG